MTTTASAITVAYTVVVVIGSLLALVVWSSMRRRPAVVEGASAGCGGCHTFASAGSTGAVAPPPP